MDEMQETGKWYEDVPYQECKEFINARLQSMTRDYIAIGYYLKYVRDHELYLEDGYKDVFEFSQNEFGMKRPTVNHCIRINNEFSIDGNSPIPDNQYEKFSKSQLQELLYIPEEKREEVTPEMTIKEIRKLNDKQLDVEPESQDELSAYGTKKMVRPEGSLLDTEGCEGGHDCFSCSMDCGIRQEGRYCREAPLGKPFPCATMNVLDSLRQDVGDKCQFISHELAYHRSGDHEPDPCCKECKEPCGYACPRAARKVTKSVAPAQEESESIDALDLSTRVHNILKKAGIDAVEQLQDMSDDELSAIRGMSKKGLDEIHNKLEAYNAAEEKPEALHFTADDKSIDNAYGAMIAELVGNYLDNAYKSPDRECEASVFGQTYKVLKRPEITVFYTEDGQTFFDVENARLEREYQWRQKNKPKPDIPEIEETEEFAPAQQEEPEPAADCPPGISSCIRQEWGTDPDQQHEGSKECAKCWKEWKKTQKALQGLQKEVQPEQVSGKVIGFEDDESVQKWQELLPDIPLFTESTIKDFLWDEERDLKKYLEVNEANRLPFKVLSRKQMIVAGLRLLLRLTGGGDGHE